MNNKLKIGIWGIVIGIIAICIAIFQIELEEVLFPTPEQSITEKLYETGKSIITGDDEKKWEASRSPVDYSIITLGILSVILGVVSWIKKEYRRLPPVAITLGTIAILWHYFVVAFVIAVIIIIMAGVS